MVGPEATALPLPPPPNAPHAPLQVVGCHMVGPDAAEIMQGLGIALKCGATKAQACLGSGV